MGNAAAVAWICLVVGVMVLGAGAYIGVNNTVATTRQDTKKKLEEAKAKLDAAMEGMGTARARIGEVRALADKEGGAANASDAAKEAADRAAVSTAEAKSTLESISSIIGALPENLRFAGVLVLVGTVLVSVATIQFGGTSLF